MDGNVLNFLADYVQMTCMAFFDFIWDIKKMLRNRGRTTA
jgi:hypothetical protein